MDKIILVGYGGHAKSVADSIERQKKYSIIGYTDVEEKDCKYNYLGTDDVLADYYVRGVQNAAICIAYLGTGDIREKIYTKLKSIGYSFPIIIDPTAVIAESVHLGEGTFIGKGAIINAESKIGKMCIINTKALVEHECIINDFSHISVAAVLCGQVSVGERVLVGANATVLQCRKIESNRIVPAGSVYGRK